MRRWMVILVILLATSKLSSAEVYVDYVHLWWQQDGSQQEQLYLPAGSSIEINRDPSTEVILRIFKTSGAPSTVDYFYADNGNGRSEIRPSNNSYETFDNIAGPSNTLVRAGINTNEGSVTITVTNIVPEHPDLVVSHIDVDGTYQVGQSVDIDCIVWNNGNMQAGPNYLGYYIETSPTGTDNRWSRDYIPFISAGLGSNQGESYTFEVSDVGTRYFVFKADYLNEVDEGDNEDNNISYYGPFTVTQPQNAQPTLTLTSPSTNAIVDQGDVVAIAWNDSDPDDNAFISLAYDTDCSEGGHIWIVIDRYEDPDDADDQYQWDTDGVPLGTYRIWGMIYDTHNPEVYSCAPGAITITEGCQVPSVPGTPDVSPSDPVPGQVYTISWNDIDGADYYQLEEHTCNGWEIAYSGSGTFNMSNHSEGSYWYRVKAFNSCRPSGWSQVRIVNVGVECYPSGTPDLQLFISEGTYNWEDQTWETNASSFDLYVISANDLHNDVIVNMVLASIDDPAGVSVDFEGTNVNTEDWVNGIPPYMDWWGDPPIPGHEGDMSFPAWYTEINTGNYNNNQVQIGDVQPDENGCFWYPCCPGNSFGEVKVYHIETNAAYSFIHFDSYTLDDYGEIITFAPFSHDVTAFGEGGLPDISISDITIPPAIAKDIPFIFEYSVTTSQNLLPDNVEITVFLQDSEHNNIQIYQRENPRYLEAGQLYTFDEMLTFSDDIADQLIDGNEYMIIVQIEHPNVIVAGSSNDRLTYEDNAAMTIFDITIPTDPAYVVSSEPFIIGYELSTSIGVPFDYIAVFIYFVADDDNEILIDLRAHQLGNGQSLVWADNITLPEEALEELEVGEYYHVKILAVHDLTPELTTYVITDQQLKYSSGYYIHVTDLHVEGDAFDGPRGIWNTLLESIQNRQGIFSTSPLFIVATGDLVDWGFDEDGTAENYNALLENLTTVRNTNGIFHYVDSNMKIPVYFCPGNHDAYRSSWGYPPSRRRAGFDTYYNHVSPTNYYSRNLNNPNIAVFLLNSGMDAQEQPDFFPESDGLYQDDISDLERDLDMLDNDPNNDSDISNYTKIAIMHHPHINLIEGDEGGGVFNNLTLQFLTICADYKVDIVHCGHVHDNVILNQAYNSTGELYQDGDVTRFVITDALMKGQIRLISLSPVGGISLIGRNIPIASVISGEAACLSEVQIYDNYGHFNGLDEDGNIVKEIPGSYYSHAYFEDSEGLLKSYTEFTLMREDSIDYVIIIESMSEDPINLEISSSTIYGECTHAKYTSIPVLEGSIAGLTAKNSIVDFLIEVEDPDGTVREVRATSFSGNVPPDIPVITDGTDMADVEVEYSYTALTTDNEDDQNSYMFDWGDGSHSDWLGAFNSGDPCQATHIWRVIGTYAVKVRAKDVWDHMSYWSDKLIVHVIDVDANLNGSVSSNESGLMGIPVDLVDSYGNLYASATTNESGYYEFADVANGNYTISISTPLGYLAESETQEVAIAGIDLTADFNLTPIEISGEQRGLGFWKHQVHVYLSGRGHAQIPQEEFCGYLDVIGTHFNNNPISPIMLYSVEQPAEQTDSLEASASILSVSGNVPMVERAKQHLMALLLNVVSLKLSQQAAISEDGATASQAITYCWSLITDENETNDETAKDMAEQINNNLTIAVGIVPLSTPNISYKGSLGEDRIMPSTFEIYQSFPNPFNAQTTIKYGLPEASYVTIDVYDLLGRKIETLVNAEQQPGYHQATWNSQNASSGVYFYQIKAGNFSETKKMLLLK